LQGKINQAMESSPAKDIEKQRQGDDDPGLFQARPGDPRGIRHPGQVLAKTRAKLEALELRVAELEALARRLRDMPGTAGAVLIAITGFGQREDGENGREAGFDHYLVKPVDPAAIVTLLAGMARR
jgi:hypothetical protein